jgi:hypothetical protein
VEDKTIIAGVNDQQSSDSDKTMFGSSPAQEKVQQQSNNQHNGYTEVLKNSGNSKNNNGLIEVRTSIKGLIFKSVVYLNSQMIDAKEVDCKDLQSISDKDTIFKERFTASHNSYMDKYMAVKPFKKVLEDEGVSSDDRHCIVLTYISEDTIKSIVQIDGIEIDKIELSVDEAIKNDEGLLKSKYTSEHKKLIEKHFKEEKFPTNTFLDPLLKKLPFYKKNPMHSFYLFLVLLAFVLWLVSLLICGKALPKIIKKVAGNEAKLVFMDIRKSMCGKCKGDCCKENPNMPECVLDKCQKLVDAGKFDQSCKDACINGVMSGEICIKIDNIQGEVLSKSYTPTPSILKFNGYGITPLFIKNNLSKDLVFKLREIQINDLSDPTITADMIITVVGMTDNSITAKKDDKFEFKLEESVLKGGSLNSGTYKGKFIFDVTGAKDGEEVLELPFEFTI